MAFKDQSTIRKATFIEIGAYTLDFPHDWNRT